jgi:protoheme IX farnesyltransferase
VKNPVLDTGISSDRKFLTALFMLPKPGIVLLSLVAGWTGVYIGSNGHPNFYILLWTTISLGLATSGAAVLNNFLDRDIDTVMQRTQKRILPSGLLPANFAYALGTLLVVLSLIVSQYYLGTLVTLLTGAAIFIYVVLYSLYFKRTTPMATHIGGVSGALPPMIGYTAAHSGLDLNAFILFLIIVVWQQPHFWALALKYREDYAKANVPILPVAKGVWATKIRLFWWTLALFPVTVLPWFTGMSGGYYLVSALLLTAVYLGFTVRFIVSHRDKEMFLFFFSIFYLGVLFIVMVWDMM